MMPKYFLDSQGGYFETITDVPTPAGATAVTRRPAAHWEWNGSTWIEGEQPNPVPPSVTKLQLRNACLETSHSGSNWWALAKAALSQADANTQEEWDLASVIDRDNATFTAFAASIGATSADIDAVFRLAATK